MSNIYFTVTVLIVSIFLTGCSGSGSSDNVRIPEELHGEGVEVAGGNFMSSFSSGELRLTSGAAGWGWVRSDALAHYRSGNWRELARLTAEKGSESNLPYFYLGRAAEELGYLEAARVYYDFANYARDCDGVFNNCDGIDVSRQVKDARARIGKKVREERDQIVMAARKEDLLSLWENDSYEVGNVRISVSSLGPDWLCDSGAITRIHIDGEINPDVSLAADRILKQKSACQKQGSEDVIRPLVTLSSRGGTVTDGYKLAKTLRAQEVSTGIRSEDLCASACALGFLGGRERFLSTTGTLLFHAPYLSPRSSGAGSGPVDCDIGDEAIAALGRFFDEMIGPENGQVLLQRTLSYCSDSEGWTVKGPNAAALFGITTSR